jgi:hypothetical protein
MAHVAAGMSGGHKAYLHLDVATYEAMVNATQVTAALLQRRCLGAPSVHTSYI